MPDSSDAARSAAAAAAAQRLAPGMTIGLGSGRAVWKVIERVTARWPDDVPLRAVVASSRTEELARQAGIELVELDPTSTGTLDLAIDGADEVDGGLGLVKGGGGALLREKLVIEAARSFVVVAEQKKRVERLGQSHPLPVEVVRFGWQATWTRLMELMPEAVLRRDDEDGRAFVTDEGHHIIDCAIPPEGDLAELAGALKATTGVVEHGLFLGMADEVLLGRDDGGVDVLSR